MVSTLTLIALCLSGFYVPATVAKRTTSRGAILEDDADDPGKVDSASAQSPSDSNLVHRVPLDVTHITPSSYLSRDSEDIIKNGTVKDADSGVAGESKDSQGLIKDGTVKDVDSGAARSSQPSSRTARLKKMFESGGAAKSTGAAGECNGDPSLINDCQVEAADSGTLPCPIDTRGNSYCAVNWCTVWAALPSEKTNSMEKNKRDQLWRQWDISNTNKMALWKMEQGVRNVDQLFYSKAAIMRAFKAAKEGRRGDYVVRKEFRLFLQYLRRYFEMYIMFRWIDTDMDGRVSLAEFNAGIPKLNQWGASISIGSRNDVERAFNLIDADDGGMILFDEFAVWANKAEQSLKLGCDGPGKQGLPSAEVPIEVSDVNLAHRVAPDVTNRVSLSLNAEQQKQRLTNFYNMHDPSKKLRVGALLRKYSRKENELWALLIKKYGDDPMSTDYDS